jgi:hypothetical protein
MYKGPGIPDRFGFSLLCFEYSVHPEIPIFSEQRQWRTNLMNLESPELLEGQPCSTRMILLKPRVLCRRVLTMARNRASLPPPLAQKLRYAVFLTASLAYYQPKIAACQQASGRLSPLPRTRNWTSNWTRNWALPNFLG